LTRYVVDASVAIKWYLPEEYSDHAERLLAPSVELLCPDLLFSEIGNTLWKYIARSECPYDKALNILKELQSNTLHVFGAASFATDALDIACRTKRTFYDSLYVALAIKAACRMVTADLKLYNALKGTAIKKHMLWVEDIP
jgi:predicted nucleic acid-binding protein